MNSPPTQQGAPGYTSVVGGTDDLVSPPGVTTMLSNWLGASMEEPGSALKLRRPQGRLLEDAYSLHQSKGKERSLLGGRASPCLHAATEVLLQIEQDKGGPLPE